MITCEYCGKQGLSSHRARHLRRCKGKAKKEQEEQQNKIKRLEEEVQELKEVEKDFIDFMKMMASSGVQNINNTINNNINNNINNTTVVNDNSRNLNMYYVIDNFKQAHNFDDLMNAPITEDERDYIIKNGSIMGCYKLLKSRCIDDIELDKRPFHCIDSSRNKYMLRNNDDWDVDQKGEKILNTSYKKMKEIYLDETIKDIDDIEDVDLYNDNLNQLLNLEGKGRLKILKELNRQTLLKNTVKTDKQNK